MILDNRRITIEEVANDIDILSASFQAIFTNVLCMKHAIAIFVPKLIIDYDLLKKVITREESWVFVLKSNKKFQNFLLG